MVSRRIKSTGERILETHWIQLRGPDYISEYEFHHEREWRFDAAWPTVKVAVEVEGGTWINGRHNRGKGYAEDCEKYNQAALLGWRVFRLTIDMLENDPVGHLMPIILFIRDQQANDRDDYEIIELD